jgi:hypothetical protein
VGFKLITLVLIGTDCTGNCRANYHTITTTTNPYGLGMIYNKTIYQVNIYFFLSFIDSGSLRVLWLLPPLKLVAMILLKVALNTINQIIYRGITTMKAPCGLGMIYNINQYTK